MIKNLKEIRSKVLKLAHSLKKEYLISFGEAQIIAWKNIKLKIALHKGPVYFSFLKKNGQTRNALGTLHNVNHLLVGSDKFKQDNFTIRYYDLEAKAFRAFKVNNLLEVKVL